jgi:DNA (cytosine-5)-methyltransferase 1
MATHTCNTCHKAFSQKGHLEDHLKRKRPCKKDITLEELVEKKVKEAMSTHLKMEPAVTITPSSTMDYSKMTVKDLTAHCKENGMKGYSGKKKEELIRLLSTTSSMKTDLTNAIVAPRRADDLLKTDATQKSDVLRDIGEFHQAMTNLIPFSCEMASSDEHRLDAMKAMKDIEWIETYVEDTRRWVSERKSMLTSFLATSSSGSFTFIDLFCGIGGFHQAMASLGGTCVLACDIDPRCREVYEKNYKMKPYPDVTKLDTDTMPDFDVLCGGFPCQAFSHSGKQLGFEDTRGTLFRDVARILANKQPTYFLLENVKNLKGHDGGRTWDVIYKALTDVGYVTYETPFVISPHMLGVPQHRERVMILGVRKDRAPSVLPPIPAIAPLMAAPSAAPLMAAPLEPHISSILESGAVGDEYNLSPTDNLVLDKWEEFVQHFKARRIKLPTFPIWTDVWDMTASYDDEPEWKRKCIHQNQEFFQAHTEFLRPWLSSARALEPFKGARRKLEWQSGAFQSGDSLWTQLFQFRPSGIRVKRATCSPALVAMAQIVYVGEKKRKLTPREVARLQSFPESFLLPSSHSVAYKQFGNSVNVEVIRWAATHLFRMTALATATTTATATATATALALATKPFGSVAICSGFQDTDE